MIVKDEKGKEYVLKCKVCGVSNKPLIGGDHKNLYCERCHQELIEKRKAKITDKVVLKDKPVEKKTRKKGE